MARLDPLLAAMVQHRMDALSLEPGRLPRLLKGGAGHDVTKTPLDSPSIVALVNEVAPEGAPPEGEGDVFAYRMGEHTFEVVFEGGLEAPRVTFTLSSAAPAAPAAGASEAPGPQPEIEDGEVEANEEELGDPDQDERPLHLVAEQESEAPEAPEAELPAARADRSAWSGPRPDLRGLLALMLEAGGSDLHLSAGQVVRARVDGSLKELGAFEPYESAEIERLVSEILPERSRRELEEHFDADFAFQIDEETRFRINVFNDRNGVSAVFRRIPVRIPSFEELGLPDSLRHLADLSKGLVLVTGPTGSGKSTTLAALLDRINERREDHILTVEDPIEFVYPSRGCLVNQREVGVHAESFGRAVRAALREDPDIILVGEMRDLETIAMAIETAETGHLVFGTLHTTTAASTVERVVGQFPGDRQAQIRMMLAGSLRAVIAQTLLKKVGGGRVAAFEILIVTPAVANLIREGKTFQIGSAMQTGRGLGMTTLTDSLFRLVDEGVVAPEEAYVKAVDKAALAEKLEAAGHPVPKTEMPPTGG